VGGARFRMDGGKDVAPFVPSKTRGGRSLTDGSPHTPIGWLETKTCFVLKAEPDPFISLCLTQFRQRLKRFFGRQLGPRHWPPEDAPGAATEPIGAGASRCANL